MGSCISINRTSLTPKAVKKHYKTKSKSNRKQRRGTGKGDARSKSPPPPLPSSEEEKVKEVLSETPTVLKLLSPLSKLKETPFIKAAHVKAAPLLTDLSQLPDEKHPKGTFTKKPCVAFRGNELPEEVPQICDTHGGVIGGLAKILEKREKTCNVGNDGFRELYQKSPARLKNRPPSDAKREKPLGRSPGRASEYSADRSRPGSISSSGHGRKKDAGEISGRRSRSPVSRTNVGSSKTDLCRSLSSRRLGKSPGRVGSGLGDRIRKLDDGKENGRDKWPLTSNEMLENPVVSLECFIFL
ncbi:hypothetical protein F511_15063 [Dorcoceras hygrometricum]|uniref:Uncharacterized protein n=1 Tax=Dorcoceras hygrometricum TaxID=472368 RepID=A0A2Z7BRA9_9LAMI|nr:hypothetical protein F511_15063 [Dorcoceras hygrometricum]